MDEKNYRRNYYTSKDSGIAFIFAMLAVFAISLLSSVIAISIANIQGVNYLVITNSVSFLIPYAFCSPLAFILTYLLYSKINKISYRAVNFNLKLGVKNTLLCIAVAIIGLLGIQFFVGGVDEILYLIGYNVNEGLLGLPLDNVGWLFLYLFLYALLPAIAEEIIFRGIVLQGLRKNMPDWMALVLSAVFFALMHCSLQQLVFPILLGLVLGWVCMRTGSLLSSMIVHFSSNALTVILAFIAVMTKNDVFSLDYSLWWIWLVAIVLLATTFAIFFLIDKYYFKHKDQREFVKLEKNKMPPLLVWIALGVGIIMLIILTILH